MAARCPGQFVGLVWEPRAPQKQSLEAAHGKKARRMDLTLDLADGKKAGAAELYRARCYIL
ncbi:MAG: hypothetical protein CMJ48_00285 [Planctomycetaceae bacterium]|nr:hypothetical protein [Planctomycetaceae bacterium]